MQILRLPQQLTSSSSGSTECLQISVFMQLSSQHCAGCCGLMSQIFFMMLLQGRVSPDAPEDAAEGGERASMLLAGLLKGMLGYQRCMPESLAEGKLDATKLLPKVGHADMHE